ncbi:hypothetical protein A2935_02050 [Candidatus Wolfebacteria bacterium RIFCSPLOWO2_01_FULL_47_17b]|uniref:Reverse transcriptase domain-containing protein n=1 Tax=Candidatus Wolfebacteria bacterium RIFCSPLOWO2_01_FULL_47_17b TaxID=1802558 RepID=A0A1F8DWH0_9BACT|nr:MAG: hypothetical protein A2935_02050 [Candidatus Wolfebacteria bacterium RIFCSPLOWO2_01_FULL_47_17b]
MFDQLTSFQNLHQAYRDARKAKRYRPAILRFGCMLEKELPILRDALRNGTYVHGTYRTFIVSDSKKRIIQAAPFRDRVVHHAVCNVIEPLFERTFIHDSYACRKDKGTHAAVKRLRSFMQSCGGGGSRVFCLKCDISKYFDSIDHGILLGLLKKGLRKETKVEPSQTKVQPWSLLNLCEQIIRSVPSGVPIGNLTSQLFANIYLNELDQYVKRVLKERYYIRYMDDFLILSTDAEHLYKQRECIRAFLRDRLKLVLHPKKSSIFPIMPNGIDFLGYRVFTHHVELRRSTVQRWKRKFKNLPADLRSDAIRDWKGYTKHAKSWKTVQGLRILK